MALTAKQDAFALAYLETGNASEAYRRAYSAENMKPETVAVKASELLAHGKVSVRVKELQEEAAERNRLTVDDLLKELEEARMIAIEDRAPAPAVSATMGKAKILGYDKQVVEHSGPNGGPIQHQDISDDQLKEKLAALGFGREANQLAGKVIGNVEPSDIREAEESAD